MKYKYIFFDFDGTLADSYDALLTTVNETLISHDIQPLTNVAPGTRLHHVYKKHSGVVDPAILKETHLRVQSRHFHKYKLFPGVKETLYLLKEKGCVLALITNANTLKIKGLLELLHLHNLFASVMTEGDVENPKPHTESFEKTFRVLGLTDKDKTYTLMVGDTEADIVGATSFGIDSAGVTYNTFGEDLTVWKPTYLLSHFEELVNIV